MIMLKNLMMMMTVVTTMMMMMLSPLPAQDKPFAVRCVSACPHASAACSRALSQRPVASSSVIQKPFHWNALSEPFL